MIAPAGHHCDVRSGHLNATFGGKDMGSMAQTGLLLVPSDALGHTWALPGALGAGQGLPSETGMGNLKTLRRLCPINGLAQILACQLPECSFGDKGVREQRGPFVAKHTPVKSVAHVWIS